MSETGAYFSKALELHKSGRLAEAVELYQRHLAEHPRDAQAMHLLGAALAGVGRRDDALRWMGKSVATAPTAGGHFNLGALLHQMGNFPEAAEQFRMAATIQPDLTPAHLSLGMSLEEIGRLDDALHEYRKTVALNPNDANAWQRLGAAAKQLNFAGESVEAFGRAVQLRPGEAVDHYNFAQALLLGGDLARGWEELEWRKHLPGIALAGGAEWDGSDPAGKTLFFFVEYGMGDAIQFVRFVPQIARRGARVIVGCWPALRRVMKSIEGVNQVSGPDEPLPAYDAYARMMSLARLVGARLESVAEAVPYVRVEPTVISAWREKLAGDESRMKIGLAWAGNPEHSNDRNRSIPPRFLAPLLELEKVSWHLLQKSSPPAELAGEHVFGHEAELSDFMETAGLIAQLDLVVTADTAVAHLAGAMGKPVWTLLPFAPDWRWLLERDDSPWYPSMRLFRQTARGDWGGVIERVKSALGQKLTA